ncbi:MAG: hypothetical protein WKG07_03360 [Hymenobacter sp.]
MAVTARDFKFPQVWRSNLAVDHELPGGLVATIEALYTKDVNAVYFQNVGLPGVARSASRGAGQPPDFLHCPTGPAGSILSPSTASTGRTARMAWPRRYHGGQPGHHRCHLAHQYQPRLLVQPHGPAAKDLQQRLLRDGGLHLLRCPLGERRRHHCAVELVGPGRVG